MKTSKKQVKIVGYVLENTLQTRQTNDGRDMIGGALIVGVPKVDSMGQFSSNREDMSEVKVEFFSLAKKKDGTDNKIYKSLLAVKEFASLASTGDIELAEKVDIVGEIKDNLFVGRDGNVVESNKITANFVNRVKVGQFVPKCEINFTGIVLGTTEEIGSDDQPTGRLFVNVGYYEDYDKSAGLVKFVADAPNAITFIQSNWEQGSNVNIVGTLNRTIITREVITEMGFGENKVDSYTSSRTDYLIKSGSYPFEEGNEFYVSPEAFQAALNVRKEKINTVKTNAEVSSAPSANSQAAAKFDF